MVSKRLSTEPGALTSGLPVREIVDMSEADSQKSSGMRPTCSSNLLEHERTVSVRGNDQASQDPAAFVGEVRRGIHELTVYVALDHHVGSWVFLTPTYRKLLQVRVQRSAHHA